ncbi:MAG: sodium:calcium antiporter [Planctomycetota bacterium]|jgi:cation:H+ antiporter
MTWILFLATTGVIVYTGSNLSKYGDVIADRTGWGRTWIGVILVASVTSLPELITGASAVVIYDELQDIAVGSVLGSCMFNLLILCVLDLFSRKSALSGRASVGHALSACFGVMLLATVAFTLLTGESVFPTFWWFSLTSVCLVFIYLASIRVLFGFERWRLSKKPDREGEETPIPGMTLRRALLLYAANSAIVVGAACYLPNLGAKIAEETGLTTSFVGNIFIALVTSLPELVACFAALRLNAVDLAYGNLFGSNLFNILILGIDDLLYADGSIYAAADVTQIWPALGAIAMNLVMIASLTLFRAKRKILLAWDTWLLLILYTAAVILMYA